MINDLFYLKVKLSQFLGKYLLNIAMENERVLLNN
jgi:hypothetical protein